MTTEEPAEPTSAIPIRCRCWMLRPGDAQARYEVCKEFEVHEFLSLEGNPMCGKCTHLAVCHEPHREDIIFEL